MLARANQVMTESKVKQKFGSISRHVVVRFCLLAVLISLAFSMMNFLFLFTMEDEFIARTLKAEKDQLVTEYQKSGAWLDPQRENMEVHLSPSTLPDDLKGTFIEEPKREEYYGQEGRHYHVEALEDGAFLVAEVSSDLIIRPWRKSILTTYGVLALLLTVIGCLLGYRLAKRTIRPLVDLSKLVEQANPEHLPDDFSGSFPRNEIGQLALALQNSMQRIKRFIIREQQFTRDVSHDLRTPLAVVAGAAEVINRHPNLDSEISDLVKRIELANNHMARTVEALLSLAREEDVSEQRSLIKVLPVVEKTIVQFSHLLKEKDVEVEVNVAPTDSIEIQTGVLEILLSNLISNAFEYTEQGTVTIQFTNGCLRISDTGKGVDESIRDRMFESNVKGFESSGFGRGLSIVKRLCEHHEIGVVVDHGEVGTNLELSFSGYT